MTTAAATICVGCGSDDDGSPVELNTDAAPTMPPARVDAGLVTDLGDVVASPVYVPAARAWIVGITADEAVELSDHDGSRLARGSEHGLLALYQKCPHLGCRVPFCESSGWFECPCHGTKFTRLGEHREGPGPRGLDSLPVDVVDGRVWIDLSELVPGPDVGFVGVDLRPTGPHCVGLAPDSDG